ncbi:IS3 family transposase (plasmid) [Sinorhizobium meliloti]|uniref:IS3 family transposase n=1 Tax=Rhizobium meliloti TaxID=382 RepID=UPI002D786C30|nr:IS3 family transposase [Sinorhizobium meliloti]WRQ72098.1 IS3 family transposase [Sinorhizobium meliloti]
MEDRDTPRLRGELPRLRRAQGLAAIEAGGLRHSPLHRRPAHAIDGTSGYHPRQADPHDDPGQHGSQPARSGDRQFKAPAPNRLWVSDFTYVATWQGFVYVAFVIDAFARRIVGWRVSRTAHAGFVLDALEQALHERRPVHGGGLIHHSDRGVQYVSIKYSERLAEAGIEPSVGSVGDSYDNALAETINGLYKAEVIHRRGPWRSFEAVEFATLEWVDWFNHRRLLEPIGNIPPAEAEEQYYAMLEEPAMAA